MINWRLILTEGLVSLIFSLGLASGGSTLTYLLLASLDERNMAHAVTTSYLDAAPQLAAATYVLFFLVAMLGLTRLRVHQRAAAHPLVHWMTALIVYGLVGLFPGLLYWLLFAAADRPGI